MPDCSQNVFQLRKEGKLDEALVAGRACLAESPQDEWSQRALGWVLHSLAERAITSGDSEGARSYSAELDGLSSMERDEMLGPKMRALRDRVSPGGHLLVQAERAEEGGRLGEAVRLYKQVLRQDPSNDRIKVKCGWVIRKQIKPLVNDDDPPIPRIDQLVREFARLDPPRSELVSRLVLRDVTRVAERYRSYLAFATKWFGLENLPEEDYLPYVKGRQANSSDLLSAFSLSLAGDTKDAPPGLPFLPSERWRKPLLSPRHWRLELRRCSTSSRTSTRRCPTTQTIGGGRTTKGSCF